MNIQDIQQCVPGFKTVAVISGPCVVRVHEALDSIFQGYPHRYFISVDFKFKEYQALNMGKIGMAGCTKAEAVKDAKWLAQRIHSARIALDAAKAYLSRCDNFTNRYTVKIQTEAFDKIISRYTAEFV